MFIIHYAPLLLLIMIGPLTAFYAVWELPIPKMVSIALGIVIFLIGCYIYFSWSLFWQKNYHGQLVTTGPFTKIRHPHYCSLLIVGFGLAFFFYSLAAVLIALGAVPIMMVSIIDEEKQLLHQYGEAYQRFMDQVRWRLIPGIF
ncbi:MAG: methyltransferase [Candidatus Thermoplasmatota archaeon]